MARTVEKLITRMRASATGVSKPYQVRQVLAAIDRTRRERDEEERDERG